MKNTHNFHGILLIEDLKLTAEAKYVLFHIYKRFEHQVVNQQVKSLSKDIGVTDKIFTQARNLLLELKYLISVPRIVSSGTNYQKGRPNIAFQISPELIAKLERFDTPNQHPRAALHTHLNRIDALMSPHALTHRAPTFMNKAKKIPLQRSDTLKVANRVLLTILYGHADPCGVVRGLGQTKLKRYTGMAQERLDSQLEKLTESGEILYRVSGVTGQHLFSRSTGTFFLNVFDERLSGEREKTSNQATLILSKFHFKNINNGQLWAYHIYQEAFHGGELFFRGIFDLKGYKMDAKAMEDLVQEIRRKFLSTRNFDSDDQVQGNISLIVTRRLDNRDFLWTRDFLGFNLRHLFRDTPPLKFIRFLQLKIHEYASVLLTKHWKDLAFDRVVLQNNLIVQISDDLYPDSLRRKTFDANLTRFVAEALGLFIYRIAYESALHARYIVTEALKDQIGLPPLHNATYAILPARDEGGMLQFSVAMTLNNTPVTERYIALDVEFGSINKKSIDLSIEIKELLERFGYHPKSDRNHA